MWWLRAIWLDRQLKFTSHINKRIQKDRNIEIQIKGLTHIYGLVLGLVYQIHLMLVQSRVLYSAEFWWKSQRNHKQTIQKLLNQ